MQLAVIRLGLVAIAYTSPMHLAAYDRTSYLATTLRTLRLHLAPRDYNLCSLVSPIRRLPFLSPAYVGTLSL